MELAHFYILSSRHSYLSHISFLTHAHTNHRSPTTLSVDSFLGFSSSFYRKKKRPVTRTVYGEGNLFTLACNIFLMIFTLLLNFNFM